MRQTRQAVCAINQSIILRCQWTIPSLSNHCLNLHWQCPPHPAPKPSYRAYPEADEAEDAGHEVQDGPHDDITQLLKRYKNIFILYIVLGPRIVDKKWKEIAIVSNILQLQSSKLRVLASLSLIIKQTWEICIPRIWHPLYKLKMNKFLFQRRIGSICVMPPNVYREIDWLLSFI
jgi:hypothetical protein